MADQLATAPRTLHRVDPDTLEEARAWIEEGHPGDCLERLEVLATAEARMDHQSLFASLLSHVLQEHPDEVERLAQLPNGPHVFHADDVGLDAAVQTTSEALANQLVEAWPTLAQKPQGPWIANIISLHLNPEDFEQIWARGWEDPDPKQAPLLEKVLWAAAARGDQEERIQHLFSDGPDHLVKTLGLERALKYIACRAEVSEERRDDLMRTLLDDHGIEAARILSEYRANLDHPGQAVIQAYRMLREDNPRALATQQLLGKALEADLDEVANDVAELFNDAAIGQVRDERFRLDDLLAVTIKEEMTQDLFDRIAEDAVQRDETGHTFLATNIHRHDIPPEFVEEWIRDNHTNEQAAEFNSQLLLKYLSDKELQENEDQDDLMGRLADLAEQLFEAHGEVGRDRALKEWHVKGKGPIHKASALMREIGDPPPEPDVDAIIKTLQEYPATLRALGGDEFEEWIRDNPRDFIMAWRYHTRPAQAYDGIEQDLPIAVEEIGSLRRAHARLEDDLAFRARMEERFERLEEANIDWKKKDLKISQDAWLEVQIAARLLDAGFEIRREPSDVLEDGPDLDFLVMDPDSDRDFWLEIRRLGRRPHEVFDRVNVGLGGGPKKSLQNKLSNQLDDGEIDPERPLVIGLKASSPMALEYSIPNSLYGVSQIGWAMGERHPVAEGISRDTEDKKGLFYEEAAQYVSGVCAFLGERPMEENLRGEMFWPVNKPPYPLPLDLYVQLRTALLGASPSNLVEKMEGIPTVTEDEAQVLVGAGIDDPSLLLAGRYDSDALALEEERIDEICAEIRWLGELQRHGRVDQLKTAAGIDLQPLYDAGIYTTAKLLRAEARPDEFPVSAWKGMRMEADRWSPLRPA